MGIRFSSRFTPCQEMRCVPRAVGATRSPARAAEARAASGSVRTVRLEGRFIPETKGTFIEAFVACIWLSCQRISRVLTHDETQGPAGWRMLVCFKSETTLPPRLGRLCDGVLA